MWVPSGTFGVGVAELEWERAADAGVPVAGRLFYPAQRQAQGGLAGWLPWRWRGVPWLWDVKYAQGLGKFLFFRLPKTLLYRAMKQAIVSIAWAVGKCQLLDLQPGAALAADAPASLPLVVFSHGLGGNRFMYSIICSELAAQGYLVLALEHADGSACAARLPGGEWRLYGGLGDEEAQVAKTRVRVGEMKAALQAVQALNRGDSSSGSLRLSDGLDAATFLRGRLDARCVAAVGHSYGGATVTALAAEDPLFRCAVALDPWWYALYPEAAALSRFATRAPLLVLGSHDWNTPNAFGQLACGGERQEKVLAAAAAQGGPGGERCGGGAMLLSISGSSHNTFADALPLFGEKAGWLLERLGLSARLDPVLGVLLCTLATLSFLSVHLPLSEEQRAVQNWEPGRGHLALDRVAARDAADALGAGGGPLSWLFPGRGLLNSISDFFLDRMLARPGPPAGAPTRKADGKGANGEGAAQNGAAGGRGDGEEDPGDVLTGTEAAEAALPSSDPSSGQHPHAPGAPSHAAVVPNGGAEGGVQDAGELEAVRAGLNKRYSGTVEGREVAEMHALLGSRHIFICRAC